MRLSFRGWNVMARDVELVLTSYKQVPIYLSTFVSL